MAREFAKIYMTIWGDPDFVSLDVSAQRLYLFLCSQADLTIYLPKHFGNGPSLVFGPQYAGGAVTARKGASKRCHRDAVGDLFIEIHSGIGAVGDPVISYNAVCTKSLCMFGAEPRVSASQYYRYVRQFPLKDRDDPFYPAVPVRHC